MLAPWASEEMKTADLPDKRLNERLAIVLSQLAGQPTASIPAACGGYAETMAAYRLFGRAAFFEDVSGRTSTPRGVVLRSGRW